MILVVGGIASGKRTWVRSAGYGKSEIALAHADGHDGAGPVLAEIQELVRGETVNPVSVAQSLAERLDVAICTEVGSGIVPLDPAERAWRDRVGLLQRELARQASCVVRMTCGIPQALKGALPQEGSLQVVMMRHGSTEASERHAYAGTTDEPLSARGEREARLAGTCPQVPLVYTSHLQRARRTAEICFPTARIVQDPGLAEMDFGAFEGRTALQMETDPAYRHWVEGGCIGRCPRGEDRANFVARVARSLRRIMLDALCRGERKVVVVAHGGTIMAAMEAFARTRRNYFDWRVGTCGSYSATVRIDDGKLMLEDEQRHDDLAFLETGMLHAAGQSFFQNRACRYFPCHAGVDPEEFNCLFCYCPLYPLGTACGGDFSYTASGRKNCTACTKPHQGERGVQLVSARYEELAALARTGYEE